MVKKTHKKSKKKTKRQKRTIKNRYEAKKYMEILNLAYKQITSSWHDIFDKDDYLLLSYIKDGIKKGWKLLHDKNIIKEIKCNSLCMTMSILNSTLGKRKKLDQLNPVQKLYLFFISYLVEDKKLKPKEVTLKHALRKIDMRIMEWRNRMMEYEKKKDNRNIKKCNKYIQRQEASKKQLIESNGLNKEGIGSAFKLDICNAVDCEYLNEYKMEKGEKWNETYSKFCLNITEIFKGIVWLNMYMIFNRTTNIKGLSPYMQKVNIDVNIRDALYAQDIILIPSSDMYESELFYEDHLLDRLRRQKTMDSFDRIFWVYHNFDPNTGKIDKRSIYHLENKHYVVALLSLPYESDWKTPKEIKEKEQYKNFMNFLKGKGKKTVLKEIYKQIKNIGGEDKYDLQENIDNSITLHWVYIHRDRIKDFISEYVS
tara:strand:+ start:969 stop:2246 length:1278 start_codon:yes stop_codon:yes gene_type:complete